VRVPFVDPEVFRAAFALPGGDKIRGRTQKAALKDVARGWIPDQVIDRPKASFGVPLRAWVDRDLRDLVDDALPNGELVQSGFLQAAPLRSLIADQRAGRRDQSKQLWQLLTLELWYRNARASGVRDP
jgi:asparagine synthase (glutamine-hydrolysing)